MSLVLLNVLFVALVLVIMSERNILYQVSREVSQRFENCVFAEVISYSRNEEAFKFVC